MQSLTFQQIAPAIAVGAAPPNAHPLARWASSDWRPLSELPLIILVGVTGVGKSTLLAQLTAQGFAHRMLPDRRDLTDRLIIAQMQTEAGESVAPVSDRRQRFAYTRAYREKYPGGMAHALAQLWIAAEAASERWIFDGLRGANEVTAAAAQLPAARFVLLDAPDLVRVQRLLGRNDAFDQVARNDTERTQPGYDLPEAAGLLQPAEVERLVQWAAQQAIPPDELRAKLQIVAEERRNYDPAATFDALHAHAPERLLRLDTVIHPPAALARTLIAWLAQ
jgi:hypothetical protein